MPDYPYCQYSAGFQVDRQMLFEEVTRHSVGRWEMTEALWRMGPTVTCEVCRTNIPFETDALRGLRCRCDDEAQENAARAYWGVLVEGW